MIPDYGTPVADPEAWIDEDGILHGGEHLNGHAVGGDDTPPDEATIKAREQVRLRIAVEARKAALRADQLARQELIAEERGRRPSMRSRLIDVRALHSIPPPQMVMGELIPARGVGFLAGPWGSYKSFVATSWSCHLAQGTAWQARPEFAVAAPVRVLYVAAEGASGIAERITAWEYDHGELPSGMLAVYPQPIQLNDAAEVGELHEIVGDLGFGFLVIDTYHRSAPGTEENSSTDFGVVFEALARIRDAHGTSSLILDHTGYNGRIRGTSAKPSDADFLLQIDMSGDDRAVKTQRTLRVEKRKDLPSEGDWPIRLHIVPEIGAQGVPYIELGEVDGAAPAKFDRDHPWWLDDLPEEIVQIRGAGRSVALSIAQVLRHVDTQTGLTKSELQSAVKDAPGGPPSRSTWQAGFALAEKVGVIATAGEKSSKFVLAERWRS